MKQTVEEKLKVIENTPHLFTCDVMKRDFIWLVDTLKKQVKINKQLQKKN